jgi:hypothetical protein
MKTVEPDGEREDLRIFQILGMTGGAAAEAMTEAEGTATEISMGPRDIVLEVQGGPMVEKTRTDGEEVITTVQIDTETLEIETMTSTRIVL